jgi:hypothetical protein
MKAYNPIANNKYSRYFELEFQKYYELQNDIKLIDLNEINTYALYDFQDDVNKYYIEIRNRKEYDRGYLTYVMFNKNKLERLYELQEQNKKYKILNYQYIWNEEDGVENYKLYCINLLDLIGEELSTCIDNQNKTCYKIPISQYICIKDYPTRIPII